MLNTLPRITFDNVTYLIDFRLKELRPVNLPFERITFAELKDVYKAMIRGIRTAQTSYGHIPELDN